MGEKKLTKKELKELRRQERLQQEQQQVRKEVKWKWFIIGAVVMGIIGVVALLMYEANKPPKPLPGISVKELGRDHVTDIGGNTYTSNPPTSGTHFPLWAKRGVYNKIISDGYLIHSLEHGYIVIFYTCGSLAKPQKSISYRKGDPLTTMPDGSDANAIMAPFTPETMPKDVQSLPASFQSTKCKTLVKNLSTFLGEFPRVVIVPRLNLDKPIVLTAWGRLEKFSAYDHDKMREFIAAFHNAGPEQTVE